ncbi:KCTD6-like protein [Mya arenaria]|uniref:KCTD6-like protein n=1 Tax=Mya arenaria TaxID=6604 RepID=A0ABY7FZV9_MYAAR|nr:BTB/POZ domain-containing protein KCTD6-like [Mya arenaria]XP_052785338.1 BTB/POZ domain-containing protein KCTD6-like [Mya arenaria]WAR27724.1 KCTD6-like protein [Mya arenaria]WAR27745.1 KCTD6-like protein [Mya arenaria]
MSKFHMISERIVKLNVGGTFYTSTKATLTKVHGSYLWRLFTGDAPCPRDEKGSYFIDRDGPTFRHILNYLRSERLAVPFGFREFDLMKIEADYYGLPALVHEIEMTLASFKRKRRRRPNRKKTSQSVSELNSIHVKNGDVYGSEEDSDWFYDYESVNAIG